MDQKSNESSTQNITTQPKKNTKYFYERLLSESFRRSWAHNKLEKFNNQEDVKYDNYLKNYSKKEKLILIVGAVGIICFDSYVCKPQNFEIKKRFQCAMIGAFAIYIANFRLQKPWVRYAYELEMGKRYEKQLREKDPNLESAFQKLKEEHNAFIKEVEVYQQIKENPIEVAAKTDEIS